MPDPRVRAYAELLVETCVDVQPGWQVMLLSSPLARPLVEEVAGCVARRGAFVIQRLDFTGATGGGVLAWIREAPDELLDQLPSIDRYTIENMDAAIAISAPENTREATGVSAERWARVAKTYLPAQQRIVSGDMPWVGCQYPTPALAQDAEMSHSAFEDFLYGACLLDWDAERARMHAVADRLDAADEVRIEAPGTELTLSLSGRNGKVDAGGANIPGGEVFYSPVEDSAEGTIAFTEFPAEYEGRQLTGIRLRFAGGRVVEASADHNEEFLIETLDTDEGARRLGEIGFGCNPGITRHMRNVLFDEKMNGTVHLALGAGFQFLGGANESAIHWDIVKDLRDGGRVFADGELIQGDGDWLV